MVTNLISNFFEVSVRADGYEHQRSGPSNCTDSDQTLGLKPTRKKYQRKNYVYHTRLQSLPKIVKDDVRRQYTIMFVNLMNSCDIFLMASFIRQFAAEKISFYKFPAHAASQESFLLNGMDVLIYYLGGIFQVSPDKVVRIKDTKLIRRSDSKGSIVVSEFSMVATVIHDVHPGVIVNSLSQMFDSVHISQSDNSDFILSEIRSDPDLPVKRRKLEGPTGILADNHVTPQTELFLEQNNRDKLFVFDPFQASSLSNQLPKLDTPFLFSCDGSITFYINEHKQIERISFVSSNHIHSEIQ